MRIGQGLFLTGRPGHVGASSALGGGAAGLVASLNISNADTWYDADDGDWASPGGLFAFASQDHTVECWVKPATGALDGTEENILGSTDDVTSMRITASTGGTWFRVGGEWVSTGAITANTWTHLAAYWDASAGQCGIMVNGSGTWTTRGSVTQSNPTNYFGFRLGSWGAGAGFSMKLAEVRLWNDLRTAQEIQDNYQKALNGGTGLVALYAGANAAVGTIATVNDEQGSNNSSRQNGTNSAWDATDTPF